MSYSVKKSGEVIIPLVASVIAFSFGLNLDFLSFRVFGISVVSVTGIQIREAVLCFGGSAFFAILALFFHRYSKSKFVYKLSGYSILVGIGTGIIGLILMFTGNNSGKQTAVTKLIDPPFGFSVQEAQFYANKLSLEIGVAVCFVGVILMALAAYFIFFTRNSSSDFDYPDYSSIYKAKTIKSPEIIDYNFLKTFWNCPNDNNKLTSLVNKTVLNPEFMVSKERIKESIDNAVAVRKINTEIIPYSQELATILLKKSTKAEITLISTVCPFCKEKYVSPKLTEWSFE